MSNKQLGQSALNTMMMVAFAVPGGAPVGILAAVGSFLFGLLYPDTKAAPQPVPVTKEDLQAAIDSLQSNVVDAQWKGKLDDIQNDLPGLIQGLHDMWEDLKARNFDPDKIALVDASGNLDQDFEDDATGYFDMVKAEAPGGMLTTLRGYRNTIKGSSETSQYLTPLQRAEMRTHHTGLYCLVSSATIMYLKAAVAWQWSLELVRALQWTEYHKKLKEYQEAVDDDPNYAIMNPAPDPKDYPGLNTGKNYKPPSWNQWIDNKSAHSPVKMLEREVQFLMNECITIPATDETPAQDGMYQFMRKGWDEYEAQMTAFDADASGNSITAGQMATAIQKGMKRALAREKVLAEYAFDGITEDDIITFQSNVDAWKAASASVGFTVYTVQPGDTLGGIAAEKYNLTDIDSPLKLLGAMVVTSKLGELNRDTVPDPNVLPPGCTLRIYSKEALPYAPVPALAQQAPDEQEDTDGSRS